MPGMILVWHPSESVIVRINGLIIGHFRFFSFLRFSIICVLCWYDKTLRMKKLNKILKHGPLTNHQNN